MSLRPAIYAADLSRFRTAIAGDRPPLLRAVERWFEEYGVEASAADIDRDIDRLLAGAWAGQPEREPQILLVAALAHACGLDAPSETIHWGDWKIGAYDDYFDLVGALLPAASVERFKFLRGGRPLFGSSIDADWAYYSYLTADEVRSFSADLATAHAISPGLDSPGCIHGFPTEFRGWMTQIERRGADLWLFAD